MSRVRYSLLKNTPPHRVNQKNTRSLTEWFASEFGGRAIDPLAPEVPPALRRKKNGLSIVERNAFVGKFSLMFLPPLCLFSRHNIPNV